MKIRRIHTQVAVMSIDHKFSFDQGQHKLEYFPELNMFKIDNTFVPVSNIREVLVEEEKSAINPQFKNKLMEPLPEENVTITKTKVKK